MVLQAALFISCATGSQSKFVFSFGRGGGGGGGLVEAGLEIFVSDA